MDNTPNNEVFFEPDNALANDQVNIPRVLMLALPPGTALTIHSDDRSWGARTERNFASTPNSSTWPATGPSKKPYKTT